MIGVVYLLENTVTGGKYVGQTVQKLERRLRQHRSDAMRRPQCALHHAIRKHGIEAFVISVLEECSDHAALNDAERKWISELGTFASGQHYNLTDGGRSVTEFSEATLAKMSAAKKGKQQTAEHREKGRLARLGTKRSAETCARIGDAHRGRKLKPEHVEKIRLIRLGKPLAESAKAALRRSVLADGIEYDSLSAASEALGVSAETISRRIGRCVPGYRTIGERRPRAKRLPEQVEKMRLVSAMPVIAEGREFPSMTAAAEALNMTRPGIAYRIKVGRPGYLMAA